MSLKWSAAMSTGVRQIDLQHAELIDIINALEAAHGAGRDTQAVDEVLPKLTAYAMFHFGTEEAMMTSLCDAKDHVAAHLREHRDFARRVEEVVARRPGPTELTAFIGFLNDWLTEHIQHTDGRLGVLLAQDANTRR